MPALTESPRSSAAVEAAPAAPRVHPPIFRTAPERIVFPAQASSPHQRPPVRIFLGTEDAQYRAERVFLYSVHKHRDPARAYEIYLMKNMRGFARGDWRTNFTNYRFAIPEWAGCQGKAIYNDVDEIYLTDPAHLFDLELGEHGYLAVSAKDTSVMLLDCQRMAEWWNVDRATREDKHSLLRSASSREGLWGPLDPGWNARDLEYDPKTSKCVHFTLLHTQPWMPSPEQYSYRPHIFGDLWFTLEREAIQSCFDPFRLQAPSARFSAATCAELAEEAGAASDTTSLLDFALRTSATRRQLVSMAPEQSLESARARLPKMEVFNPRRISSWPEEMGDTSLVVDTLENLPAEDVPWFLREVFARTRISVAIRVRGTTSDVIETPHERDRHLCRRPAAWWLEQVAEAAPGRIAWRLEVVDEKNGTTLRCVESQSRDEVGEPRVWVLLGSKGGDNAQALELADALAWPYETKHLRFNRLFKLSNLLLDGSLLSLAKGLAETLRPPWPDIVICTGRRSAPIARWIRARAGKAVRLVTLGRPRSPYSWFDLIITTPQYDLPARPNVLHNLLPLHGLDTPTSTPPTELDTWRQRLSHLPRPYTVLLVGGDSSTCVLDAATGQKLAGEVSCAVRERGGSLLVVTGPRTSTAAASAIASGIGVPHYFHRFEPGAKENPYRAFLALADRLVVTGDSASMLAEACFVGAPVTVYPLPTRKKTHPLRDLLRLVLYRRGARSSYRGTPKQQDRLARVYDELVVRGLLTPRRNLSELHARLRANGLVQIGFDDSAPPAIPGRNLQDMARAVERIHALWWAPRSV